MSGAQRKRELIEATRGYVAGDNLARMSLALDALADCVVLSREEAAFLEVLVHDGANEREQKKASALLAPGIPGYGSSKED